MPSPNVCSILVGAILAPSLAMAGPFPSVADPASPYAPLQYHSPFENYRRAPSTAVGDWRQANDRVREVGGFAGALKDDPPSQPSAGRDGAAGAPHTHQPGQNR